MFVCHSGRASISRDAHERGRQPDHERARTAHAGRPRQVAREGHLGGERGARESFARAAGRRLRRSAASPCAGTPARPRPDRSCPASRSPSAARRRRGPGPAGGTPRRPGREARRTRGCARPRSRCACRRPRAGRAPTTHTDRRGAAPRDCRTPRGPDRRARASRGARRDSGRTPRGRQRDRRRSWLGNDPCQPPLDLRGVGAARQIEHGPARGQRPEPHASRDRQPTASGSSNSPAPSAARRGTPRRCANRSASSSC